MNKKEVQKRVLKNGKQLPLKDFTWDEETNTFSSNISGLVLDFEGMSDCTFKTSYNCVFNTDSICTFKTGSNCTFNTDSYCTFNTGSNCTFDTSYNCTFKTYSYCTFDTGYNCVVVRRDIFEVIQLLKKENKIQLAPYGIKGYIENGLYSETGKNAVIADGILSEVISTKEKDGVTVRKVINHGTEKQTYLLEIDGVYSHGKTLKEARESYKYKISNRDTSQFKDLTVDSMLTQEEAIKLYRVVTGACESGTRYFVENLKDKPKKLTVKELIKLTKGQYNHDLLVKFFTERS